MWRRTRECRRGHKHYTERVVNQTSDIYFPRGQESTMHVSVKSLQSTHSTTALRGMQGGAREKKKGGSRERDGSYESRK